MATRRSSRTKKQVKQEAELDLMDVDQGLVDDDGTFNEKFEDEFEEPQEKKRKRRAPQVKDEPQASGSTVKKPRRGTRGVLKQMLEMPFDIIFEIFGHLLPADLLSVGRTSQELRELVMSGQFKSIWAHARARYPGMPECPDDMSEPAYAELIFGNGCLACGKTVGKQYHIWRARTRLCNKCFDNRYDIAGYGHEMALPNVYGIPDNLSRSISACRLVLKRGRRHVRTWFFCTDQRDTWRTALASLETKEEKDNWCLEKIAERAPINEHALRCEEWFPQLQTVLQDQKTSDITERKAQVVQLLKSMGWGDELAKMTADLPQDSPEVMKHCRKKITPRILENLTPFLEQFMKEAKEKRIMTERRSCYENRMKALKDAYNNALATYPLYKPRPRVGDIFEIPRIKDLIKDTPDDEVVDASEFGITPETLDDVMQEAKSIIEAKILSVVAEGLQGKDYNSDTVLDLATTVFCFANSYEKKPLHTSQVVTDMRTGVCNTDDLFQMVESRVFESVAFNSRGTLTFDRASHDAICGYLVNWGFDPETATFDELEEKKAVVECVTCNQITYGRLVMRWWDARRHAMSNHSDNYPPAFELLTGEDATRANEILNNGDERRKYQLGQHGASNAVCLLCDENTARTVINLRNHIKDQHAMMYPKIGQDYRFIYEVNVSYSQTLTDAQRMWPGRPA